MSQEMKIYNNLIRGKAPFKPVDEGKVKFYSCGPTTYDFLHVGNARALVVGDLFHRVFKALGYDVTFVRNFTDVDDKIIKAANENKVDPLVHSAKYIQECKKDMDSLGMLPATHTPKVSETMDEIIFMVKDLVEKGAAYAIDGEVFFHVPSFKTYGKLSKKDIDSLEHRQRVEVDERKKHPSDFVLWKPAKEGEPSWDSPWGKGRPGWHIECSAMAKKYLGDTIDIHHGGIDLIFPHHENEIAQSESANGCDFCNCWSHNEFVNFGSEKMSKSLGNVVTIRSFIEKFSGQVLRQLFVSSHYRTKLEWSDGAVERAIGDVERIHEFVRDVKSATSRDENVDEKLMAKLSGVVDRMKSELSNDFNSAGAISHFFTCIRDVRRELLKDNSLPEKVMFVLFDIIQFTQDALGLVNKNPEQVLADINSYRKDETGGDQVSDDEIEKLIAERKDARAQKNWGRADEIRDIFKEKGIVVKDNPDGTTTWKFA